MIRRSITEEDTTFIKIIYMYMYICIYIYIYVYKSKLTAIKGDIDRNTIIVRVFNTSLTSMD